MKKAQVFTSKRIEKKRMGMTEDKQKDRSPELPRPVDNSRTAPPDQGAAGNVDKIRDILFGSQMRDYEGRFERLEEKLLKESADLKETTRRRFDALEAYMKKELEALLSRLKTEREERSATDKTLSQDLKELNESLGRKISELDERTSDDQRDLRSEILRQAGVLAEEMRSKHESLSALFDRRLNELRGSKTDRAALAELFNEVALRLTDEFKIPGAED